MSKVKINKKLQKSSVLKVVGLVFMVVTLLTALALTNNTVRQFITSSFAFDYECAQKGSPGARNECQQRNDDNRRAAQLTVQINQRNFYYNFLHSLVSQGRATQTQLMTIMDQVDRAISSGNLK